MLAHGQRRGRGAGRDPDNSPLTSDAADLSNYWTYEVSIFNQDDDATLPADVLRVESVAKQFGNTYLQADVYLLRIDSIFFVDMVRVQDVGSMPMGMGTAWLGDIHTNGEAILNFDYGVSQNLVSFPMGGKLTFSDAVDGTQDQTEPTVSGGQTWAQIFGSAGIDGWEGPVDVREIPELNLGQGDNISTGDPDGDPATKDSLWDLVVGNAAAEPPDTEDVVAATGGGVYVHVADPANDDVEISLSLIDPNNGNSTVNWNFDNNTATDMWGGTDTSTLDQRMTIDVLSTGNTYQVDFVEGGDVDSDGETWGDADDQVKVYKYNGATFDLIQTVNGAGEDLVWIEGNLSNITGANKNERVYTANSINVDLDASGAPLLRADVEPARVTKLDQDGNSIYAPHTDSNTSRDGFTLATWGDFSYSVTAQAAFAGNNSQKWYFTYANLLVTGDITYDSSSQSNLDLFTACSMLSQGALTLTRQSNDSYIFIQDPSNRSFPLVPPDPINVHHYQQTYYRSGQ